jgi:hypothetical protein
LMFSTRRVVVLEDMSLYILVVLKNLKKRKSDNEIRG